MTCALCSCMYMCCGVVNVYVVYICLLSVLFAYIDALTFVVVLAHMLFALLVS